MRTKVSSTNAALSQEPLYLFRALLRECTYLPDPNARVFLHNHIVDRFRRYTPRSTTGFGSDRRRKCKDPSLIAQRRPVLLRTATKAVKFLRRANCGHRTNLEKILEMTYGRLGPRKHQLMEDLTAVEAPKDSAALDRVLTNQADPRNQNVPNPSPKLLALLHSQASNKSNHFPRRVLRVWQLKIPEKNKWGRSLPLCRVRNLKRRWYAGVLDKVLVPLPAEEWFTLQQRVNGEIPFEGAPARRTASSPELQSSLQDYKHDRRISRPHRVTARFMRRLWERIFAQCPLLTPDPEKPKGWGVEWGEPKLEWPFGLPGGASKTRSSFSRDGLVGMFEGVNEFGEIESGKKQVNDILSKPHKSRKKQRIAAAP